MEVIATKFNTLSSSEERSLGDNDVAAMICSCL